MPIPPDPILRGAVRWLERLPTSGIPRLRAIFSTHPAYSDLTPTQYEVALGWLETCGLLDAVADSRSPCELRVLDAAISTSGALWFRDADVLVQSVDDLPGDLSRAAEALGIDETAAFRQMAAAWGKIDLAERNRIGAVGEALLVDLLERSTTAGVDHVALSADGYGYDIAVTSPTACMHFEVKSTTRQQRVVVYLSRNEFETMLRDSNWVLVIVRLSPELQLGGVATVPSDWVLRSAPANRSMYGRWESFRLEVPPDVPVPGISIPKLLMRDDPNGILAGMTW